MTKDLDGLSDETELTLEEAAELVDRHYMTVYRWVRTSRLTAVKRDDRWYVTAADLRTALSAGGRPGRRPADAAPRDSAPTLRQLAERLIAGDGVGAHQLIESTLAAGMSAEDVHLDLLGGAMRHVGEQWASGSLSVAEEHRATAEALRLMGALAPHFQRPGRRRGTVVLGAPAGDHHGLPSALLIDPIRGRGFDPVDLGPDAPPSAFAETVSGLDRVVAVGIHTSVTYGRPVAETITALRELSTPIRIVLGGHGIADAAHATALGADHYADSARAALDALTRTP